MTTATLKPVRKSAKSAAGKAAARGTALPMTPARELAVAKASVKHLMAHPGEAIALMAKAGICTADGRLKKAYGGKA